MKYLLLIHGNEAEEAKMTPEEGTALLQRYGEVGEEIAQAGGMLGGQRLRPTDTATTVKVRDGERIVTDGPYAELKEALGGFYMVEAPNLDQAIEWASKIPAAETAAVEVRPIRDEDCMSEGEQG